MSAVITITMDELRGLLAGMAEAGQSEVSTRQLAQILDLESEPEKARLRRRLQNLLRQRDLERVQDGVWRWIGKLERVKTGDAYKRLWRAIRASKPGYDAKGLAVVANVCARITWSYLAWLEEEGFVERYGRSGNARLYRTTILGRDTPITPFPPRPKAEPFAAEKAAALGIVSEMLAGDLYQPGPRRRIATHARTLLARFEKEEADAEGDLETEEAAGLPEAAGEAGLAGGRGGQTRRQAATPGAE